MTLTLTTCVDWCKSCSIDYRFPVCRQVPTYAYVHCSSWSSISCPISFLPPWQRRLCFWELWFVCVFVCLFVCGQHYSKSYERIRLKFYGGVLGSTMKNWLNFGGDPGLLRWVNEQKNTIIVVAYPDRGADNGPKLFFLRGGSLSPPRLNIFTVGNMGVMICLGQGGLRSLSASSFK